MRTSARRQDTNQNTKVSATNIEEFPKLILDYTPYEYPQDVNVITDELKRAKLVYAKNDKELGGIYYYNVPASFDIETTSTYVNDKKVGTMYVWMFSVCGKVILGRTWEEFDELMNTISEYTSLTKRLIVYIHNMGFDFTFFSRRVQWYKTFCADIRVPIYAIAENGVEFRDSYILTGKNLDQSAKDLLKYKVEKLVGDLDYSLPRGCTTPLTSKEKEYCVHDCLVIDAIIQERIEQEGKITRIPLTNTGYVRRFLKNKCYPAANGRANKKDNDKKKEYWKYRNLMNKLTLTVDEYKMAERAFMGGFTHANARMVNERIDEKRFGRIDSFDFTSSYPASLCEKYPMSKGEIVSDLTEEGFRKVLEDKLSIFDIQFNEIVAKDDAPDHYLSVSKVKGEGIKEDNGRVVKADWLLTTITNIDFEIICNLYDFESIQLGDVLIYEKNYLPKPIIEGILELYKAKTELKNVVSDDGSAEANYILKKGMLNAVYGCFATSVVKPTITFTNQEEYSSDNTGWDTEDPDLEEALIKYNENRHRWGFFPWACFCTAYARRNLFMGIIEFGVEDYIYSDTDSIKCINADKHMKFIEYYNELVTAKIRRCLEYHGIDPSESSPKTVKGVPKPLGVWDWETEKFPYKSFKTLGAKRYLYTQDEVDDKGDIHENVIHITIAGLSKKKGGEYIGSQEDPYKFFNNEMDVPPEGTGKLMHTYIDDLMEGTFYDYNGVEQHFRELGAVHLEPTGYTLKISKKFEDYLQRVKES